MFKVSDLKHIIDVEMDGDRVIVTYLMHEDERRAEDPEEMPEEQEGHHDEDPEEMAYHDDESEEMAMDDEDDKDKEKHFLTTIEREFLALFTNEEK